MVPGGDLEFPFGLARDYILHWIPAPARTLCPKRVVGIEIRGLAHAKNKILSFSFSTPKFSVKLRDKN